MKRVLCLALLTSFAVVTAVTLVAQAPKGWLVRADRSTNATDPDAAGTIQFMSMGTGFHAVTPQAAVFWNPASTTTGNYSIKGTFRLIKPSGHTNYYGLVFGASDLGGATQRYTYFLVAQDGTWLIKKRSGNTDTTDVAPKTPNDVVKKPDANGTSTNALEVRVLADKIDYLVNGTVVHSTPKTGITTDGIWGLRVNHLLEVHIDGLSMTKG